MRTIVLWGAFILLASLPTSIFNMVMRDCLLFCCCHCFKSLSRLEQYPVSDLLPNKPLCHRFVHGIQMLQCQFLSGNVVHLFQNTIDSRGISCCQIGLLDTEEFSCTQMQQTTLLWFAAIMTLQTLKARQCELMAPLRLSQFALSRPQQNRVQLKTNTLSMSLSALSLFSHIIFNSFQVI